MSTLAIQLSPLTTQMYARILFLEQHCRKLEAAINALEDDNIQTDVIVNNTSASVVHSSATSDAQPGPFSSSSLQLDADQRTTVSEQPRNDDTQNAETNSVESETLYSESEASVSLMAETADPINQRHSLRHSSTTLYTFKYNVNALCHEFNFHEPCQRIRCKHRHLCAICLKPSHSIKKCPDGKGFVWQTYCVVWNSKGQCAKNERCKFRHACLKCEAGDHGSCDCTVSLVASSESFLNNIVPNQTNSFSFLSKLISF
ncbi:hypothetical protein BCR33DRAFT_713244 [Rhizoclosmatium globosum]|uniref:C3H1-type domain-containing protein n=1 Tax=Rhizoclosmatium globosum TaxID=329046 RepID=A0A1Y2CU78_9FUNG|nr:hypothetical protein BCR33DRAFT_713244 [Rhizoclosmatium globosum]|eukprot:ORY50446.1 hypothetical protein BCR33DRAFT_713244 [Rhizoclosmatium globosum]